MTGYTVGRAILGRGPSGRRPEGRLAADNRLVTKLVYQLKPGDLVVLKVTEVESNGATGRRLVRWLTGRQTTSTLVNMSTSESVTVLKDQ